MKPDQHVSVQCCHHSLRLWVVTISILTSRLPFSNSIESLLALQSFIAPFCKHNLESCFYNCLFGWLCGKSAVSHTLLLGGQLLSVELSLFTYCQQSVRSMEGLLATPAVAPMHNWMYTWDIMVGRINLFIIQLSWQLSSSHWQQYWFMKTISYISLGCTIYPASIGE